MINYDEFRKVELKVGKVISAERVEGSEKLLKLQVDLGEKDETDLPAGRQVVAGIGKNYEPGSLIGKEIIVVANLEPRQLMGIESQGMLLAADGENGPVILTPNSAVPPGSGIK